MSEWQCPICYEELGELNVYCVYCKVNNDKTIFNPDKYYVRDVFVRHIVDWRKELTPQEELFSQLFNHEKILVKDMDILTLRSHREELAKIAFEARARLTAADDEEKEREKISHPKGPKGFETSVNTDETSTNAINTIKTRQAKLSGKEKIQAGLVKLFEQSGMTHEDAVKEAFSRMGAGAILARVNDQKSKDIISGKDRIVRSPLSQENGFVMKPKEEEKKPIFNPFEKK